MNLKVAVVDDEAPIRQWLTYCIGTIAPEDKISTAAIGAEALEMIVQVQPDIVFTDICMPVMDGLELMRQAKKTLPFTKNLRTALSKQKKEPKKRAVRRR